MSKEFVLALTEHRKFGVVFVSYVITPEEGNSFYSSIERANQINIKDADNYNDTLEKIQALILQYDDSQIANFFTKKKEDAVEFIKNVGEDLVNSRIRPFVEKRMHKIFNLMLQTDVRLYFKDKKYAKIYAADQVNVAGPNAKAVFNFTRTSEGLQYFLNIHAEDGIVSLKNKRAHVVTQNPCTLLLSNRLYRFQHIDHKKLQPFFTKDFIQIPKQTEQTYFEKFVYNAIKLFKVKASGFDIVDEELDPKIHLYLQNNLAGAPALLLKYEYGPKVLLPNNPEKVLLYLDYHPDKVSFTRVPRNFAFEKNTVQSLQQMGLRTADQSYFNPVQTGDEEDEALHAIVNWLNKHAEALKEMGVQVRQDFFDTRFLLEKIQINMKVQEDNDWFDVRGMVELGAFKIPFIRLRKHILRHIRAYELPDGTVAILPLEWFAKYKDLFAFSEQAGENLHLNKMHFQLVQAQLQGVDKKKYKDIGELFSGEFTEIPVPEGVQAILRPYQLNGFNWMNQLRLNGFGGCLADDMGLGKTLQTLTLLQESAKDRMELPKLNGELVQKQLSLFEEAQPVETDSVSPTSLIVMPASLIHNWYNEAKKFTPNLKVLCHTGNQRSKDPMRFQYYDLVLTTYGVVRNDAEQMAKFPFYYLILDESQAIKNPDSKNYKSVIQLRSKYKLALTGTPIENSLMDLWSQVNFINRGLLGSFAYFKKEFVAPIEKFKSRNTSEKLQHLIHPFILRRTKDEVAKDLPPKTEQIRICEMHPAQKKMYEEEKSAVRNNILEAMEQNGAGSSSMLVLESLMRLRQLANHPHLVNEDASSGKFEEVTRMLENVLSEGHKVLIFSSFVKHLSLYEAYLKEQNKSYSILTGQTQNRDQVIQDFQDNPENQVFLISLKAGGVGLNLTAADYVFMLDPWWNPASENQAVNRAHRIGQEKKVFVYRFISAGSIEEKIVQLQEKKSDLANQFVNNNNPFKSLSVESVRDLFT